MSGHKKMILLGIVLILMALGVFLLWRTVFSRPNPPLPKSTVRIGDMSFMVEFATSTVAQARGLSGRPSLAEGAGMIFPFKNPGIQSFWMKDMNFPIDMIWIGGNKVLGFAENAEPQPGTPLFGLKIYRSPDGVDTVLEVPAGTVAKDAIKVGDAVVITE
jgi:uncharacterized membrane protein (UPF0127 family)